MELSIRNVTVSTEASNNRAVIILQSAYETMSTLSPNKFSGPDIQ